MEAELPDTDQEEERDEGRGKKESLPYMKRQGVEATGEEWEAT